MKKYYLLLFAVFIAQLAFAQNYLEEVNGRPIKGSMQSDVSGDPYLFKDWKLATVQFTDGKTFANIPFNIDLVTSTPLFAGPKNEKLGFVDELKSFAIADTINGLATIARYKKVENERDNAYFKVISEGKLSLLKKEWKVVWEDKTYNSATITKTILAKSAYYIQDNATKAMVLFKPSKKNFLAAIPDHKTELEAFLKNRIDFSNDDDLSKLFMFYNGL